MFVYELYHNLEGVLKDIRGFVSVILSFELPVDVFNELF